ncbi:hypothetical protein C0992_012660 [Termitomyces sp. T32_za158]|nr:hypothetical protein C0992_012660 [Termitomyces sp. T32_za158]
MGCYGLRDEERLKNIRYYTPFCQTLSTSKPYPHEIISDDKFLEGFAKLFDAPTTHGHQTNGPVQCTPEIAPSRAKTPYECDILDQIDSANILHAPLSASLGPDTELTPAPEGESKPVTSVPAETATIKGGSDIPLPTASSNPSTADPPAQTTFAEINSSIDKIRTIESTFNALKENFTLPAELDFICSTPSTPSTPSISNSGSETESVSATDHLTYSPLNRPVRSYEQALTVLLEQLDGVESLGDTDVRKSRREVVKRVELALDELERDVDGQWRIRVLEPLVNESKLSSKSESHGAVLGLGLHDWKSETGQEDDTQKKDTSDDCADVISSSLPEVMEQNNPSTANTTVNSPDDLSAQNITTPVHDTNPIQAPLVNQLKFSDAIPVADITPSPAQATDFVPSSVPIASTTKLPGDAEIALSISSASSVLEPTPITPSNAIANANAIIHDQEGSIPVNMPAKFAVEPSTPSSLESSSTMSENSGLTTLQGAEIEPEGFFLALSGADESVSGNPITHDSDEEWLEVDA